jgi:hypothetical protein
MRDIADHPPGLRSSWSCRRSTQRKPCWPDQTEQNNTKRTHVAASTNARLAWEYIKQHKALNSHHYGKAKNSDSLRPGDGYCGIQGRGEGPDKRVVEPDSLSPHERNVVSHQKHLATLGRDLAKRARSQIAKMYTPAHACGDTQP